MPKKLSKEIKEMFGLSNEYEADYNKRQAKVDEFQDVINEFELLKNDLESELKSIKDELMHINSNSKAISNELDLTKKAVVAGLTDANVTLVRGFKRIDEASTRLATIIGLVTTLTYLIWYLS